MVVGTRPWTANVLFLSFPKMLSALITCVRRGEGEKKGTGVKWASHYYLYYKHYVDQYTRRLSSFIALLISFVSYFKICDSLFSICQLYASFSSFLFTLRRQCKTGIFSVSPLACRLNAR